MLGGLHPKGRRGIAMQSQCPKQFACIGAQCSQYQPCIKADCRCLQGTSVPIAIPMGLREERDSTPDSPEEPGGIHAATFVPPHMLEQARSGALELTNSVHVRP